MMRSFARPEIQLNAQFNSSTTTNNVLVITAEAASALEKRIEPINKELDELAKAYEAKVRNRTGTGRDQIREVEATLMSDQRIDGSTPTPITLPPPIGRHPNWWAMLSRGDGHREITKEAATFIIKTIATDALGAARASGLKISFDDASLTPARCLGRLGERVRPFRLGSIGQARRVMSIRVRLASDAPGEPRENRPKILVTLNGQPSVASLQLPAPQAVEPPPPKVLAFWHADERTPPPWRLESEADRQSREEAEKHGCWTG